MPHSPLQHCAFWAHAAPRSAQSPVLQVLALLVSETTVVTLVTAFDVDPPFVDTPVVATYEVVETE